MSDFVIGTVTGTGVALNVPIGFQPRLVELYNYTSANLEEMKWVSGMAAGYALKRKDSTFSKITSAGISMYAGGAAAVTDLAGIVAVANLTSTALTIIGQPDQPRKLVITIVDTTASITVGNITIVGKDKDGNAVTEVINCAAGAGTYTSTYKYYTVTSITTAAFATLGGAGDETIKVGWGAPTNESVDYLAEGFTVGTDTDMNVAAQEILYIAYR